MPKTQRLQAQGSHGFSPLMKDDSLADHLYTLPYYYLLFAPIQVIYESYISQR